eukprot:10772241-Ditylum_brightwellii.AAC.1
MNTTVPQTETSQSSLKESGPLTSAKPQLSMMQQIPQHHIYNPPMNMLKKEHKKQNRVKISCQTLSPSSSSSHNSK